MTAPGAATPILQSGSGHTQDGSCAFDYGDTPPGFRCPGCGQDGPLRVGEVLANDTVVACRHRWICRYSWKAPGAVAAVTCPRCGTVQPGPDARRISAQLARWLGE